jgi:hypothetical protein
MIRTGYEDMVDPEFNRQCLDEERASCGVNLSQLLGANSRKADLPPAMSLQLEPATAA